MSKYNGRPHKTCLKSTVYGHTRKEDTERSPRFSSSAMRNEIKSKCIDIEGEEEEEEDHDVAI